MIYLPRLTETPEREKVLVRKENENFIIQLKSRLHGFVYFWGELESVAAWVTNKEQIPPYKFGILYAGAQRFNKSEDAMKVIKKYPRLVELFDKGFLTIEHFKGVEQ